MKLKLGDRVETTEKTTIRGEGTITGVFNEGIGGYDAKLDNYELPMWFFADELKLIEEEDGEDG